MIRALAVLLIALLMTGASASAYWTVQGHGRGYAKSCVWVKFKCKK